MKRFIKGYGKKYLVDTKGVVYVKKVNGYKIRKSSKNKNGYMVVTLRLMNGKTKTNYIHKIVLETFVGPCPDGKQARHFPDRNRSNNNLNNLSWATPKENQKDRVAHKTTSIGDKHPNHKIKDADIPKIVKLRKTGKYTLIELAGMFNVHRNTIVYCIKHRSKNLTNKLP